jgi:hypothetical protein
MKVFVKNSWRVSPGQDRVYHTDEDCIHLNKTTPERIMEKELVNLVDVRECKECSGESDIGRGDSDHELNQFLQRDDIGPEDVGLTPEGER